MASPGKPSKNNPFLNPLNQPNFPSWTHTTASTNNDFSISIGDSSDPSWTVGSNIESVYVTGTNPQPTVKLVTKEDAINLINAHINALAQKANRLARLREFFQSLNSNQQDLIKDFWETIKKELQS